MRQQSTRSFRFRHMLAASAIALCAGVPAFAQDTAPAAETDTGTLQDIVVTAQFRSQNLQNTPIAITAVNAAMLEARSQSDLSQVAAQAPSVVLQPLGASFGPALGASIRGIGQFDFNPAYEPGVGIYVDDVYYPTLTGSVFDLLDLDRVEVLRGPQGTLTGRNSIGGAIKLFSKKPTGDGSGYVEATYGIRNKISVRGSADLKLADNLYARISGVTKHQEGYVKHYDYGCVNPTSGIASTRTPGNCLIDKLGGVGYTAIRGIVRYEPSDGFDVTVAADYTNDDRTVPGEVLIFANNNVAAVRAPGDTAPIAYDSRFICGKYCNYAQFSQPATATAKGTSFADRTTFKGYGFSGTVRGDVTDNMEMESITAYRHYNTSFAAEDDLSPANLGFGLNKLSHRFFSEELRLNGQIGSGIDYTLGGYYSNQKTVYFTQQDIRYIGFAFQFYGDDPVKADSKAVFAHAAWRATDALTVTGGVRYTKESKDYTFVRRNYDGTINAALASLDGYTAGYKGDRFDYRVSVDYRWSPQLLTYATVSTGFKGGGVSARPFNALQAVSFNPETVRAYEIGAKTDLFDRHLRLNVSAYYNDYKDMQIPLRDCTPYGGGPCGVVTNGGDGKFKGIEGEAQIFPVEHLMIDAAASYIDFHYTRINPAVGGPAFPIGPQISDPFGNVPKWKWSAGIQYEIPVSDIGTVTPRFDIAYQAKLYSARLADGTLFFVPSYTVANARLTWKNEKEDWQASLEVTNLFDKYYIVNRFEALTSSGATKASPGRPREWGVTIKKKF